MVSKEEHFNNLDSQVGDGDLGTGMALSAKALIKLFENSLDQQQYYDQYFFEMGDTTARMCGGSSGPFYSAFLMKFSQAFKEARTGTVKDGHARAIFEGFKNGREAIQYLGRAEYTDRTMLYVLNKIYEGLDVELKKDDKLSVKGLFESALKLGQNAAEEVKQVLPKKGRSQYLGERVLGLPDPGCEFVVEWVRFFAENL